MIISCNKGHIVFSFNLRGNKLKLALTMKSLKFSSNILLGLIEAIPTKYVASIIIFSRVEDYDFDE